MPFCVMGGSFVHLDAGATFPPPPCMQGPWFGLANSSRASIFVSNEVRAPFLARVSHCSPFPAWSSVSFVTWYVHVSSWWCFPYHCMSFGVQGCGICLVVSPNRKTDGCISLSKRPPAGLFVSRSDSKGNSPGSNRRIPNQRPGSFGRDVLVSTWQGRPPLPLRLSSLSHFDVGSHPPFLGRYLRVPARNPRLPSTRVRVLLIGTSFPFPLELSFLSNPGSFPFEGR